jgi:cytochrome c-type biogenesis protein CcmH/NrfG
MTHDSKARMAILGVVVLAVVASYAAMYHFLVARTGGSSLPGALTSPPARPMSALPSTSPAPSSAPGAASGAKGAPTLVQAAERLSKRLESQDGTADDWTLLARTYVELQQYPDAVRAFQHALQKSPDDAAVRKEAEAAQKAAAGAPVPR